MCANLGVSDGPPNSIRVYAKPSQIDLVIEDGRGIELKLGQIREAVICEYMPLYVTDDS